MELDKVMRTTFTCRRFDGRPVPRDVLVRAFERARFAPQGGNRQGVRFVVVEDRAKKEALAGWYQATMAPLRQASARGETEVAGEHGTKPLSSQMTAQAIEDTYHLVDHYAEAPAIVVACVDLHTVHVTDAGLDRQSVVGGGSVYPMVQNLCLALRDEGVGSALTTLLCEYEPEVKALLAIPAEFATAAYLAVGYPLRGFPAKLRRRPVSELVFVDTFGNPIE